MSEDKTSKKARLTAFVVMSIAIVGYFTGIQAPMPETPTALLPPHDETEDNINVNDGVIPATHYSNMAEATQSLRHVAQLTGFKSAIDPLAEIKIQPEEKLVALQRREQNRAYNGAPPTITHPMDQRTDASCVACHRDGVMTKSLRIPRMSHGILTNCTQCHVESRSQHMTPTAFRESTFEGLAAPAEGPRSFPGAAASNTALDMDAI